MLMRVRGQAVRLAVKSYALETSMHVKYPGSEGRFCSTQTGTVSWTLG